MRRQARLAVYVVPGLAIFNFLAMRLVVDGVMVTLVLQGSMILLAVLAAALLRVPATPTRHWCSGSWPSGRRSRPGWSAWPCRRWPLSAGPTADHPAEHRAAHPVAPVGPQSALESCDLASGDDGWMARADRALYAARAAGRNRIEVAGRRSVPTKLSPSLVSLAMNGGTVSA